MQASKWREGRVSLSSNKRGRRGKGTIRARPSPRHVSLYVWCPGNSRYCMYIGGPLRRPPSLYLPIGRGTYIHIIIVRYWSWTRKTRRTHISRSCSLPDHLARRQEHTSSSLHDWGAGRQQRPPVRTARDAREHIFVRCIASLWLVLRWLLSPITSAIPQW